MRYIMIDSRKYDFNQAVRPPHPSKSNCFFGSSAFLDHAQDKVMLFDSHMEYRTQKSSTEKHVEALFAKTSST